MHTGTLSIVWFWFCFCVCCFICLRVYMWSWSNVRGRYDWMTDEWKKFGVRTSRVPLASPFCACFNRSGNKEVLDFQEPRGITSAEQWNLHPVIGSVDNESLELSAPDPSLKVSSVYWHCPSQTLVVMLANGYFANRHFEHLCKVPRRPSAMEREAGKRLDPSCKNMRPADSLKNVRLFCALKLKVPFYKVPVCEPSTLVATRCDGVWCLCLPERACSRSLTTWKSFHTIGDKKMTYLILSPDEWF